MLRTTFFPEDGLARNLPLYPQIRLRSVWPCPVLVPVLDLVLVPSSVGWRKSVRTTLCIPSVPNRPGCAWAELAWLAEELGPGILLGHSTTLLPQLEVRLINNSCQTSPRPRCVVLSSFLLTRPAWTTAWTNLPAGDLLLLLRSHLGSNCTRLVKGPQPTQQAIPFQQLTPLFW